LIHNDFEVSADYVNKRLGINITVDEQVDYCFKMGHTAAKIDNDKFTVKVSPLRADILHACDISKEIGVAFGFNNIPRVVPETNTVGKLLPINKFTDMLWMEIAQAGFVEILTSGLVSKQEIFDFLWIPFA